MAIHSVIPEQPAHSSPQEIHGSFLIESGVLVGFTGDMKLSLFINGEQEVFSFFAELLYGMSLDGDMLHSFTAEVGNMIAGNLSTNLAKCSIKTDITAPILLEGGSYIMTDWTWGIVWSFVFQTRV